VGGGTGPATGSKATTCTPGQAHLAFMLRATDELPLNLGFLGKGNTAHPLGLPEQIAAREPAIARLEHVAQDARLRGGLVHIAVEARHRVPPVHARDQHPGPVHAAALQEPRRPLDGRVVDRADAHVRALPGAQRGLDQPAVERREGEGLETEEIGIV